MTNTEKARISARHQPLSTSRPSDFEPIRHLGRRGVQSAMRPDHSPKGGDQIMFPIHHDIVSGLLSERLAEASSDRLARQVAHDAQAGPEPSRLHRARLAMGVALVRAGQAVLPADDRGRQDRPGAAA